MKNSYYLITVLLSLLSIEKSYSADKYFIGGLSIAQYIETYGKTSHPKGSFDGTSNFIVGFHGGILFEKPKPNKRYHFNSGILWETKGGKKLNYTLSGEEKFENIRTHFIEFPFLLKFDFPIKTDGKIVFSSGPTLNFEIFSREVTLTQKKVEYLQFMEIGYLLMLGYDHKKLSYRAFVDFGFLNLISLASFDGGSYRNRNFGFSIGYILPSRKHLKTTKITLD